MRIFERWEGIYKNGQTSGRLVKYSQTKINKFKQRNASTNGKLNKQFKACVTSNLSKKASRKFIYKKIDQDPTQCPKN